MTLEEAKAKAEKRIEMLLKRAEEADEEKREWEEIREKTEDIFSRATILSWIYGKEKLAKSSREEVEMLKILLKIPPCSL